MADLTPADVLEIINALEIVSGRLSDGSVHITYVIPEPVLSRYGDETITNAVRLALRTGAQMMGQEEE